MVLAIDIGNTNIVLGGFEGEKIAFRTRLATSLDKGEAEYAVLIHSLLDIYGVDFGAIEGSIISSVVPPVFNSVRTGVIKIIGKQPMVVGPGLKTGLNIHMDVPSQVGSDRIVIAVAALAEYEANGTENLRSIVFHLTPDVRHKLACRIIEKEGMEALYPIMFWLDKEKLEAVIQEKYI